MDYNKYLITEGKVSQMSLDKKFRFLDGELRSSVVRSLWQYLDPRYTGQGVIYSKEKSVTDELLKRLNLDSFIEHLPSGKEDSIITMIKKAYGSLNIDREFTYDKKRGAFIHNSKN